MTSYLPVFKPTIIGQPGPIGKSGPPAVIPYCQGFELNEATGYTRFVGFDGGDSSIYPVFYKIPRDSVIKNFRCGVLITANNSVTEMEIRLNKITSSTTVLHTITLTDLSNDLHEFDVPDEFEVKTNDKISITINVTNATMPFDISGKFFGGYNIE